MTGKEWIVLRGNCVGTSSTTATPGMTTPTSGPATSTSGLSVIQTGAIIGVASSSQEEPLRTDFTDFPTLKSLGGMKKYSDWRFCAETANAEIHWKTWDAYHEGGN
jgi:hypothetical protein